MSNPKTAHAITAAEVSLLALCASVACFLPPLNERFLDNVALVVALGIAVAASLVLHLIFVGLVARELGRPPLRWAALAFILLPIGSIVGLVLLEWQQAAQRAARPGSA